MKPSPEIIAQLRACHAWIQANWQNVLRPIGCSTDENSNPHIFRCYCFQKWLNSIEDGPGESFNSEYIPRSVHERGLLAIWIMCSPILAKDEAMQLQLSLIPNMFVRVGLLAHRACNGLPPWKMDEPGNQFLQTLTELLDSCKPAEITTYRYGSNKTDYYAQLEHDKHRIAFIDYCKTIVSISAEAIATVIFEQNSSIFYDPVKLMYSPDDCPLAGLLGSFTISQIGAAILQRGSLES